MHSQTRGWVGLALIGIFSMFSACGDSSKDTGSGTSPDGGKDNATTGEDNATTGEDNATTGEDNAGFAGSCHVTTAGFCSEYTGSSHTADMWETSCKGGGAGFEYLAGRCPKAMQLGCCVTFSGKPEEVVNCYYSPTFTLSSAKDNCDMGGGTWK